VLPIEKPRVRRAFRGRVLGQTLRMSRRRYSTHQIIALAVHQSVAPQVDHTVLLRLLERQQRVFAGPLAPRVDLPIVSGHVRVVVFDVGQIFVQVILAAARDTVARVINGKKKHRFSSRHSLQQDFQKRKRQQTAYAHEHELGHEPLLPEIRRQVPSRVDRVPKLLRLRSIILFRQRCARLSMILGRRFLRNLLGFLPEAYRRRLVVVQSSSSSEGAK